MYTIFFTRIPWFLVSIHTQFSIVIISPEWFFFLQKLSSPPVIFYFVQVKNHSFSTNLNQNSIVIHVERQRLDGSSTPVHVIIGLKKTVFFREVEEFIILGQKCDREDFFDFVFCFLKYTTTDFTTYYEFTNVHKFDYTLWYIIITEFLIPILVTLYKC